MADTAQTLKIDNFGPIVKSSVTFADLTVLVGPQATGKSLFLQTLKLLVDQRYILDVFKRHNVDFRKSGEAFLDGYYGRGMASAWSNRSRVAWNGKARSVPDLWKMPPKASAYERMFYIPAQRVVSLRDGSTQNFGQFSFGDPYNLRAFSDAVHDLVQNEFAAVDELFPAPNRLNEALRTPINEHLFGHARLNVDPSEYTRRMVLQVEGQKQGLSYLAWSAGQREFVPLLLGIYWLCPAGYGARRRSGDNAAEQIEWVVIEEPEMGLHPQGITAVLLLVLELLKRGYRVILSTHSTVVLDMIWALRVCKEKGGQPADIQALFRQKKSGHMDALAAGALAAEYAVYLFNRDGKTSDISRLDPASLETGEADWGGLNDFSDRAAEIVAGVVGRRALRVSEPKPRKGGKS